MYDFFSHPDVVSKPSPWQLHGNGFILLYAFPRDLTYPLPFPSYLAQPRLRTGCVIIADYHQSEVGPYRELLFIPGFFQYGRRFHATITRIYVSTWSSILNGRANWGIPKQLGGFQLEQEQPDVDRIRVSTDDQPLLDLSLRSKGPVFPLHLGLIPRYLRTLLHPYKGQHYLTQLGGRGRLRYARLLNAQVFTDQFPDFTRGRLLAAFKVTDFLLTFPIARVLPWPLQAPG